MKNRRGKEGKPPTHGFLINDVVSLFLSLYFSICLFLCVQSPFLFCLSLFVDIYPVSLSLSFFFLSNLPLFFVSLFLCSFNSVSLSFFLSLHFSLSFSFSLSTSVLSLSRLSFLLILFCRFFLSGLTSLLGLSFFPSHFFLQPRLSVFCVQKLEIVFHIRSPQVKTN